MSLWIQIIISYSFNWFGYVRSGFTKVQHLTEGLLTCSQPGSGCQSSRDAHAPVTRLWAGSGYRCSYARTRSPGDQGLLELTSAPHSQLNSFLSSLSKRRMLILFLTSLNQEAMVLRSQGKEAGAPFPHRILLFCYSCINYSGFLLLNCCVPSYFSSCPRDEDISLSGEIIPICRINQVLCNLQKKADLLNMYY